MMASSRWPWPPTSPGSDAAATSGRWKSPDWPRSSIRRCRAPGPAQFDITALLALNRRVLQSMSFADVALRLPTGATEAFWHAVRGTLDLLTECRGYWDVVAGTIVPPVIEGEGAFLRTALEELPTEPWNETVFPRWAAALQAQTGRSGNALLLPLRLALTGEEQGPDLQFLLPLIGRARAAQRLEIAAN